MEQPVIFYHVCREPGVIEFSHWHDARITLKIVVDVFPEEVVNKHNPNIHWVSATEFDAFRKSNISRMVFIELPSLSHVPLLGENIDVRIPEGWGVMVPVFDFDWVYYTKSDNGADDKIMRLSHHTIRIENKMTDREAWIANHVRPCWEQLEQERTSLGVHHKRVFHGLSKVLNEWRLVEELSVECAWPQPFVEFDRAEAAFHTQLRLPLQERQQEFFLSLTKNQYCFETWWHSLELADNGCDTSVVKVRLMLKMILNEYHADPHEWSHDVPLGRWIQRKVTDDDVLFQREISILKNFITPDFAPFWGKHLLSRVIRLKNPYSHRVFTQESIHFLDRLTGLDGCEKGELLFSRDNLDFVPSSSGLVVYPDNPRWCVVNVRKVNYRILQNGSYVTIKNGSINPTYNGISKNEFYLMDRETLRPVSPVRPMTEDIPGNREDEVAIVGLEDVRLVTGINQDILFYGVTKSYSYSGAIRIIEGKYDVGRAVFHDTRVIHPPYEENACEKNWTWCGQNRYIYRWHPVEIGSVDANNRLVVDEHVPSPSYFREFRGSSPAVIWKGYHFFSVHSVMMGDNGRKYIHSVIVMDLQSKQHKVVGVCSPFCFEDTQIEYNIGLDIYNGKMLFLYSTRDSTSKYVRIPMCHIIEKMVYLEKQTELDFKTRTYQDVF